MCFLNKYPVLWGFCGLLLPFLYIRAYMHRQIIYFKGGKIFLLLEEKKWWSYLKSWRIGLMPILLEGSVYLFLRFSCIWYFLFSKFTVSLYGIFRNICHLVEDIIALITKGYTVCFSCYFDRNSVWGREGRASGVSKW